MAGKMPYLFQCQRKEICHFVTIGMASALSFWKWLVKVFAKIIQRNIQVVVEDLVVDAQHEFRSGCDCTDMVFCAWQLEEKAIEHTIKVFLLFVDFMDLQTAYNSVPRSAICG